MHRIKLVFLTLVATIMLFVVPVAFAHANLVRSEPVADSAQPVPPTHVRLWFSEDVEPRFTSISVVDTNGKRVDKNDSHRLPDDSKGMEVSLNDLPLGLYTVAWQSVSAVDGHATAGSFSFTVGDKPLADSSPREIISQVQAALDVSELPPTQEIVVRWLNLLTLSLLTGSFAFPNLILFPSTRIIIASHPERTLSERSESKWESKEAAKQSATKTEIVSSHSSTPLRQAQGRSESLLAMTAAGQAWNVRWLQYTAIILILYAVMTGALLMNQSIISGGAGSIPTILTATRFGYIWLLRVILLVALGVLLFRARFDVQSMRLWRLGAGLSLLLIISQSLNSHNAAVSDPPIVPLLTDIVHLLGTAIWIGGLAQLLVTVPMLLKSLDAKMRVQMLTPIIARFSLVAFITVGAIILTGMFATLVQVGSFEAFFGTLYGTSLFFKIALMLPLLAVAALNLIVTRPALAQSIATRTDSITRVTSVIMRFNVSVVFEILFAVAILFIVGILTSTAPARSAYNPSPKLWLETQHVDDLRITLAASPALVGRNDFDVYLRDDAGQPVSNATVVRLLGTSGEMNMGTQELTTVPQGNGHYTTRADLLSMVGKWNIEVLARRAGHDDARATFNLVAYNQVPPPTAPTAVIALNQPLVQSGLGLALFGLVLGTASVLFLKQRNVRLVMLIGAIVVSTVGTMVVTQTPVTATASPNFTVPVVPEFARLARIPFRADANRITSGQRNFQDHCVMCHGESGKGDGPGAANLNPKPFDLTVHIPLHTDGELYWYVTNGIPGTAMPAWNNSFSDDERWEIVAYIRRAFGGNATPTASP